MKRIIFFMLITFLSNNSYANWEVVEVKSKIVSLGVHEPMRGFVNFSEGINAKCPYGHLYFDISKDLGKAMYSTLLSIRATNSKLRVAYDFPTAASENLCVLKFVAYID